jgi:hypothetical protein
MNFVVEFLSNFDINGAASIIRTADFEAKDIHSIIARTRIILSSPTYEPKVHGFRVIKSDGEILHDESRDMIDLIRLDLL